MCLIDHHVTNLEFGKLLEDTRLNERLWIRDQVLHRAAARASPNGFPLLGRPASSEESYPKTGILEPAGLIGHERQKRENHEGGPVQECGGQGETE